MRLGALVWLPLLLALGGPASADDGPPHTVHRLAERPTTRAPAPRELVLFVGGYGTVPGDAGWDALAARFADRDRYDVRHFGTLGEPYDTVGSLDQNANALTRQVRAAAANGSAVHLVAHSMGGAVVDRALALGLGAGDGVRTYVALSAPHAGSSLALVAQRTLSEAGDDRALARALIASTITDPDTTAVRDLARRIDPPAHDTRIARLDLRFATDAVVLHPDARGPPGVDARTLLPTSIDALEGHGATLRDARALDLIEATIRGGAPPPDERGVLLSLAADAADRTWSAIAALGLAVAAATLVAALRLRRAARLPGLRVAW